MSKLEKEFELLWENIYPDIDIYKEVALIPKRRFRFDYVHLAAKVAVEIQGQIWKKGGHSSGTGLLRDYEKFNLVQAEGYILFLLSKEMITEYWINMIGNTIKQRLNYQRENKHAA